MHFTTHGAALGRIQLFLAWQMSVPLALLLLLLLLLLHDP